MTSLLPTSAEVRCQIAVDLPLQLEGMLMMTNSRYDAEQFIKYHVSRRDQMLIQRLGVVIPKADLELAGGDQGLDIGALARRVPSAYAMLVMITALAVEQAVSMIADAEN